jgi:8-oxo-dGTP pyrophosphatase MutT (NUDIX family)
MNEQANPATQVYTFQTNPELRVVKNNTSPFRRFFSDLEMEKLIHLYSEKTNATHLFNGKSVRLDKVTNIGSSTIIHVSMIEFFDFLLTTMLYNQRDSFVRFCEDNKRYEEKALIERFCDFIDSQGSVNSFEGVIDIKELSNILAVSILVEDRNGLVGLMRRSKNVAVSSGILSVTATGSLDEQDFHENNPFISCAKRELREELNIETDSIVLDELVMSKHKLQPIALLNVKLPHDWKDLAKCIKSAKDFNYETQEMYAVPISDLSQFLYSEKFTDAASYQIYKKMIHAGVQIEPVRSGFNKEQYLI